MKLVVQFFVEGVPQPQGSKTMVPGAVIGNPDGMGAVWRFHGRWHRAVLKEGKGKGAKRHKAWQATVVRCALQAWRGREPLNKLWVGAVFVFPWRRADLDKQGVRKSSADPNKNTRPDTDKLQRSIGDALQKAGVCADDSRIVGWRDPCKVYGKIPGAQIAIYAPETDQKWDSTQHTVHGKALTRHSTDSELISPKP